MLKLSSIKDNDIVAIFVKDINEWRIGTVQFVIEESNDLSVSCQDYDKVYYYHDIINIIILKND